MKTYVSEYIAGDDIKAGQLVYLDDNGQARRIPNPIGLAANSTQPLEILQVIIYGAVSFNPTTSFWRRTVRRLRNKGIIR